MREGDTMKLLIFGIDAADPKILFHYLDEFPTISKLAREGSYGKLQGYSFGYGSYDNWATIFTGLPPREHGVIRKSGNSPESAPRSTTSSRTIRSGTYSTGTVSRPRSYGA
jgi:predicted AlkP superfamily phosphohydrolase/phosphomutase